MSLTITVESRPLRTVLDSLLTVMNDLSPVMSEIGMEFENRVRGRFETQSDPDGVPWTPWKPATLKSYPKNGNRRLLNREGDLLRSLNHHFDSTSAEIGFGDPKAAFHEWGTEHMERRGMLFDDPDAGTIAPGDEVMLLDIVRDILNTRTA
jgi:phage virion morphogenesis protein